MSPAQEVCVDASLAVKVVVPEPDSYTADALFDEWTYEGKQLIAPAFFAVETDSILLTFATTNVSLAGATTRHCSWSTCGHELRRRLASCIQESEISIRAGWR